MKSRVQLSLLFLAAALCTGGVWPLEPATTTSIVSALLGLVALLRFLDGRTWSWRTELRPTAAITAGIGLSASAPTASLAILGVALCAWGCMTDVDRAAADENAERARAIASPASAFVILAVLVELRIHDPVRTAYEWFAASVCRASAALTKGSLELGPTALGLELCVLAFLLLNASARPRTWKSALKRALATDVVLGFLLVAYAVGFHKWIAATREFTREASEEGPIVFAGVPLLAAALMVVVAVAPQRRAPETTRSTSRWASAVACASLVLLLFGLAASRSASQLEGSTVLLVRSSPSDDGFDGDPRPSYGYHQDEGYRALRRWLTAWGCEVRFTSLAELAAPTFADVDVAVYVSPSIPEGDAVREYVERGGCVLIVGDHTPSAATLESLNAFLAPFDLAYQFDSVFPCLVGPRIALRAGGADMRRALGAAPDPCFGVGASLRAGSRANVLLESRWSVGDRGFADSAALLGNRHYDHGDRLSDLPIIASGERGRGKVVVVGDTGSFLDSAMPFSYPFIRSIFVEAISRARYTRWSGAFGALVLLLITAFVAQRSAPSAAIALAIGLGVPECAAGPELAVPAAAENVIAIDSTLRSLSATFDRSPASSIRGFAYQCAASGRMPIVAGELSAAIEARPDALVLISPATAPNAAQRAAICEFVESGGELWIAVGYEEIASSQALLADFGVLVAPRPFGSSRQRMANAALSYREAWEVVVQDGRTAETLGETFGHPIVRRVQHGLGHVTVFGDSYFFCDDNIGTGETTNDASAQFLGKLLAKLQ
ncbi:MAG: hypothetical protein IT459_17055 [Planctomycetes bacterium]|nr:hypothetical protein [Planctomycetota bacterium]